EVPNVIDSVLEHSQALDAHAEGKSTPLVRIDRHSQEHIRINHPTAEQLEPAAVPACSAAGPHAKRTLAIEFRAWLGEWEKIRSEARVERLTEQYPDEFVECSLQLPECYVPIDQQPFHLMKERIFACVDFFISVDAPWRDHAQGWFSLLHDANLYG